MRDYYGWYRLMPHLAARKNGCWCVEPIDKPGGGRYATAAISALSRDYEGAKIFSLCENLCGFREEAAGNC